MASPFGKGKGKESKGKESRAPRVDWFSSGPREEDGPMAIDPAWEPADHERNKRTRTTLGLLKVLGHVHFAHYEHRHLVYIREILTTHWWQMQGGTDDATDFMWQEVFGALELDLQTQVALRLLAQHGLPGRAAANRIMWETLANLATDPEHFGVSHKAYAMVNLSRRAIDRPPEWAHERAS